MSNTVALSNNVKFELTQLKNDETVVETIRRRAAAILYFCEGNITFTKVSQYVNVRIATVSKWVKNFISKGVEGIKNTSGRRSISNSNKVENDSEIDYNTENVSETYTNFPFTSLQNSSITEQNEGNNKIEVKNYQENNTDSNSITLESQDNNILDAVECKGNNEFYNNNNLCNQKADIQLSNEYQPNIIEFTSNAQNQDKIDQSPSECLINESNIINDFKTKENAKITISIKIENIDNILEEHIVVSSTIPSITGINYSDKDAFACSFKDIYYSILNPVIDATNKTVINYVNSFVPIDEKNKKIYYCNVETFTGRLQIQIPHELRVKFATNERVFDPLFYEKTMNLATTISIREAAFFLKELTFRKEDIKHRTLSDLILREGKRIAEQMSKDRSIILESNGFNPENGEVINENKIDEEIKNPHIPTDKDEIIYEKTLESIENYNENKVNKSEMISFEECQNLQETHPDYSVIISADYVDVWKQKENRTSNKYEDKINQNLSNDSLEDKIDAGKKSRKKVRQATVHVTTKEGKRVFVGKTILIALLNALAYLLMWGFLKNRKLIFFTDGAKDLNNTIKKIFSFREFEIKLDWFHLVKKCYEFLSMALYGGKVNRENNLKIRKILYRIIFVGNVEEAKKYIDSILKKCIKDKSKLQELKDYLDKRKEFIYCYAIRKSLNMINSSNLAETFNNLCVSQICKSNSKSYSQDGVNAIAIIRSIILNKETNWFDKRELNYQPVPHSQTTIDKIEKLNKSHDILVCA